MNSRDVHFYDHYLHLLRLWMVNFFVFVFFVFSFGYAYRIHTYFQDERMVGMTSEAREWYRMNAKSKDDYGKDDKETKKLKPNSEAFKTHPFGILYSKWYSSAMTNFRAFKEQGGKKANVKDSDFNAFTRPIRFSCDETNSKLIELYEALKKPDAIYDSFRDKRYHVRCFSWFCEFII